MYKSQADAVKEWLQAYRGNQEHIDKQLDKLRTMKARMMSVGAQELTDMPKAPNASNDRMTEYVIRVENLELSIQNEIAVQEESRKVICDLIKQLEKPEEMRIIQDRYLYCMEWSEVLERLYKSDEKYVQNIEAYRRRMFRVHEDALLKMAKGWNKYGSKS